MWQQTNKKPCNPVRMMKPLICDVIWDILLSIKQIISPFCWQQPITFTELEGNVDSTKPAVWSFFFFPDRRFPFPEGDISRYLVLTDSVKPTIIVFTRTKNIKNSKHSVSVNGTFVDNNYRFCLKGVSRGNLDEICPQGLAACECCVFALSFCVHVVCVLWVQQCNGSLCESHNPGALRSARVSDGEGVCVFSCAALFSSHLCDDLQRVLSLLPHYHPTLECTDFDFGPVALWRLSQYWVILPQKTSEP